MNHPLALAALAAWCAAPARADAVTEALESAIEAYGAGDVNYAREGWTPEVDTEMNRGLATMDGGTGAAATYAGGGESFTVTLMADKPMVGAMGAMFGNPMLMGAAGEIGRVGRQKSVDQDGELTTLVDNRIPVRASGAGREVMLPVLEAIDYAGLAGFGR